MKALCPAPLMQNYMIKSVKMTKKSIFREQFSWKVRNFATEYSRKYVFIMATVVLQVPDESLVSKVKNACKMLVGVTSVKVHKATKKKDYDITKTAGYREAMDDVKNGRVTTYDSVDDMFKKLGINV